MQPTYPSRESISTPREEKPDQMASSSPLTFVWFDPLELGDGHASSLQPERLRQAYQLLEKTGTLNSPSIQLIRPNERWSTLDALLEFHHPNYCKNLLEWDDTKDLWSAEWFGFSTTGTVPFLGMAEIAQQYVSATRTAVRFAAAHTEVPTKVVCLAGTQVHACREKVKSGDIFNDIALALLDANRLAKKVAFINLDAEHPTIIQDLFFKDPNLMTISLHEDPFFLYPGTGKVAEIGEGQGRGYNINIPLPPRAGDRQIKEAFKQVIHPLLKQFAPNLVIMLGGPSAHVKESLAHLRLTTHGYQQIVSNLAAIAPRFVLLGGSGSNWEVSARLWTLAVATLTGQAKPITIDTSADSPMVEKDSTVILTPSLDLSAVSEHRTRFDIDLLHDEPIDVLSDSMREYLEHNFQLTLLQAQQHLFPLWKIPISIDEQLVLSNINLLYGVNITEKKIGNQTDSSENRASSSSRLAGQDEDNELKRQKSYSNVSTRAQPKPHTNRLPEQRVESIQSPIEEEPKLRKERKEVMSGSDSADDSGLAANQEATHRSQNDQNRSQRAPSGKRKRSRRRRRRSGGK